MAHQPLFVGSLEWWGRIIHSDVFVLSDHNDFEPYSNQNRHMVDGFVRVLPVVHEGRPLPINETRIVWDDPHVRKLRRVAAEGWPREKHKALARELLSGALDGGGTLGQVTCRLIRLIAETLPVDTVVMLARSLSPLAGGQSDAISAWCRSTGATEYWCGISGSEYLRPEVFETMGVKVVEVRPAPPSLYPSALDAIAAVGPDAVVKLMPRPKPSRTLTASV
jgi:hypothetical protein